jgi:hypothetical protein
VFVTGFVDTSSGGFCATVGYDAATGTPLWQARLPGLSGAFTTPRSVTVSPDGSRVFVTGVIRQPSGLLWAPSAYLTVAYSA